MCVIYRNTRRFEGHYLTDIAVVKAIDIRGVGCRLASNAACGFVREVRKKIHQFSGAPVASHAWICAICAVVGHAPCGGIVPPSVGVHNGDALGSTSTEVAALPPGAINPALTNPV